VPITATAVPTGSAGSGTSATPITATVSNRTTSRG
jgi:hypothetical protein